MEKAIAIITLKLLNSSKFMQGELYNPVMLSRIQFSVTTLFHMLWPLLSIGLGLLLVLLEGLWLKTGREIYYRHTRFWGKLFLHKRRIFRQYTWFRGRLGFYARSGLFGDYAFRMGKGLPRCPFFRYFNGGVGRVNFCVLDYGCQFLDAGPQGHKNRKRRRCCY
jgi:hypothetical protein